MARRITTGDLVALLDEHADDEAASKPIVATDGDGTLWRGDIGDTLFLAALRRRALRHEALEALVAEADEHGITLSRRDDANQVAGELLWAWGAGRYPDWPCFAMMAWAFAGWGTEELAQFCRGVLDEFDFRRALRLELIPVIQWGRARGVPIWLVSAAPAAIAREAARRLGIDRERVVAMEPAEQDGVLLPRLHGRATYGEGKLLRLRERTDAPLLAALGDSGYDAAVLGAARIAVAVSPSKALRERVEKIDGAVILETS